MKPFEKARAYLRKWVEDRKGQITDEESLDLMAYLEWKARDMIHGRPEQDYQDLAMEFLSEAQLPEGLTDEELWHKFTWGYFEFLDDKRKARGQKNRDLLCTASQIPAHLKPKETTLKSLEHAGLGDIPPSTLEKMARTQAQMREMLDSHPSACMWIEKQGSPAHNLLRRLFEEIADSPERQRRRSRCYS
jgi:hypothetical protein